ncbi:hypothetical protein OSTOST_06319, partial [Ostertagia ostertagi]
MASSCNYEHPHYPFIRILVSVDARSSSSRLPAWFLTSNSGGILVCGRNTSLCTVTEFIRLHSASLPFLKIAIGAIGASDDRDGALYRARAFAFLIVARFCVAVLRLPLYSNDGIFSTIWYSIRWLLQHHDIHAHLEHCILFGAGTLLIFGIKDVASFREIVPFEFSLSDSVISLCVGFVVSLYQLTSSPLLYQAYFPIPTLYKLRLTLAFHGVFQLFSSILVFLTISLFFAFVEKRCTLLYSYRTFFLFAKHTVPHPALAYAVIVSLLTVFMFCIQWLYVCITTHVWEEFIKGHLRELGTMKQLCCVQSLLLITCAVSVSVVSVIRLLQLPYDLLTPFSVLVILTLCGGMCGVFMCGYFLPFCNSKGALAALFLTTLSSISLFFLFASNNPLPALKNSCVVEIASNSTIQIRSFNMEKMIAIASHIPLQAHTVIAFMVSEV